MKMADGSGSWALDFHTEECKGDQHGTFFHTSELTDSPFPGMWVLHTCKHCGTQTWRNTKGERHPA